ncbi:MAG TPA: DUF302 domain-containing protein [Pseudonocardiaceae bacterium]|jgi:hypothetical protein|nr:DUF302 domain-containing protein [Pseudonocardiaceae bacterium]
MIVKYTVENREHVSAKSYEEVVAVFEAAVGDAEHGEVTEALRTVDNAGDWEQAMVALFGPAGFVRVFSLDHGRWQGLYGTKAKAKKYVYGNPIVAETMLRHDLRAGLQVPLSIMIREDDDGHARVSYDLPSSAMGFIDNPDLAEAAMALDARLTAFVRELTGAAA